MSSNDTHKLDISRKSKSGYLHYPLKYQLRHIVPARKKKQKQNKTNKKLLLQSMHDRSKYFFCENRLDKALMSETERSQDHFALQLH